MTDHFQTSTPEPAHPDPAHSDPARFDPAPSGGGYRMRPEEVWNEARDAYLYGFTAEEICERYDLGLSAFRARARREEWRRSDQPADSAIPDAAVTDADAAATREDLAAIAWGQAAAAMRRGRSTDAQRWLRIHADLTRPPRPGPDRLDGLAQRVDAIGHVARSIGMDPAAFHAADRAVREHRAATGKVHDVHPNFDSALSHGPDSVSPTLSRADRRRLARMQRGKGPD